MQDPARQRGEDEMARVDIVDSRTKDRVQVGANSGEEIGQ
jgi:hypothetical protein